MKNLIISLAGIISGMTVSIVSCIRTINSQKQTLLLSSAIDNEDKKSLYFAELIAAIDEYSNTSYDDDKTKVNKAAARFLHYAPPEFHQEIIKLIAELDSGFPLGTLRIKKNLIRKYSECIINSRKGTYKKRKK